MDRASGYVNLVTSEYLKEINKEMIRLGGGEGVGVKDENLFQSLLIGYNQEVFGISVYPNIKDKISYIVFSIICNHVFRDGNKRTGMFVLTSLCNKFKIDISNIDRKELAILLGTSSITLEDLAGIIKKNNINYRKNN